MGNRIYVGNLSYDLSTQELKDAFANCGSVTDARVMTDRESGQSRGFGFVTFSTDAEAQKAIETWNGENLGGRKLVVNEARERENSGGGPRHSGGVPRASEGGGGGGGGDRGRGGKSGGGRRRDDRDDRRDRY